MSVESDLIAWIIASIADHFNTLKGSRYFHFENLKRPSNMPDNRFEVRINGPHFESLSSEYCITVELSVIVQTKKVTDIFEHDKFVGEVISMMDRCITVKKYAGGDESLVGLLKPKEDISNYKYDDKDGNEMLTHSSLETYYTMEVDK